VAKETYIFREPTNRSHPIAVSVYHTVFSSAWCSEWWCVALVCCNVLRFWNVPSTSWSGYSIFLISHAVIMRGQLKLQTCAPDWCWCTLQHVCKPLPHTATFTCAWDWCWCPSKLRHSSTHCNALQHCEPLPHTATLTCAWDWCWCPSKFRHS